MESGTSNQDRLAESTISASHTFERLEHVTAQMVRYLVSETLGHSSAPLRCESIEGERNQLSVFAPPLQPARIRYWPMVAGGRVVTRFSVERQGREEIGETQWVRVGMFDLDMAGVVWLPDDNGDPTEGAEIFGPFETNWASGRNLIYRIYHWLATQAVTAA